MFKTVQLRETPKIETGGDVRKRPGRPRGSTDTKPRTRRTRAQMEADGLSGTGTRPRAARQVQLLTPKEEKLIKEQRAARGKAQRGRTKEQREARAELELDKLSRQAQQGTPAQRKSAQERLRDVEVELAGRPLTIAEARKLAASQKEREARRRETAKEKREAAREKKTRGEIAKQSRIIETQSKATRDSFKRKLESEVTRLIGEATVDGDLTRAELRDLGAKLDALATETGASTGAIVDELRTQGVLTAKQLIELGSIVMEANKPGGAAGAAAATPGPLTPLQKRSAINSIQKAANFEAALPPETDVGALKEMRTTLNDLYREVTGKSRGQIKTTSTKGVTIRQNIIDWAKKESAATLKQIQDLYAQKLIGTPVKFGSTLGHADSMPLHEHVKRACRHTFDHMEHHGKRKSMDHILALREVHSDLEKALKFIKGY